MKVTLIVSAIIRHDDHILMIEQPDDDKKLYWFIPGGVVESGEMITEALSREVKEETGLTISGDSHLAFVTQIYTAHDTGQTLAFVFDVSVYSGEVMPDDPDHLTHQAIFVPIDKVIQRLIQVKWASMRDPLIAYLSRNSPQGCIWQYHENASGLFDLVQKTL